MTPEHMLGWREWLALPDLGIDRIKCKIDTGARSSALHTSFLDIFRVDGAEWVRFGVNPDQRNSDRELICESPVIDRRSVRDSGGHREMRYVISTPVTVGEQTWDIEVTLTHRKQMLFRMLLGRTAMKGRFVVDPARSYLAGSRLSSIRPAKVG